MIGERKQPSVAFWTTMVVVVVVVLVAYPLSLGPACWLCNCEHFNSRLIWVLYRPVTWAWYHVRPSPASAALVWWCDLIGKPTRDSIHGYGIPQPLRHEVAAQNPGVRFL